MNNNHENNEMLPPTELPVPELGMTGQTEIVGQRPVTEVAGAQAVEMPHSSQSPSSPVQATNLPPQATSTGAGATPRQIGHIAGTPSIADDSDLIEKEWVQKAKDIVARTKDDPHAQNKVMGAYKADYVKKRFNKDIKVSE